LKESLGASVAKKMCFKKSSERIEGKSRLPHGRSPGGRSFHSRGPAAEKLICGHYALCDFWYAGPWKTLTYLLTCTYGIDRANHLSAFDTHHTRTHRTAGHARTFLLQLYSAEYNTVIWLRDMAIKAAVAQWNQDRSTQIARRRN